MKNSPPGGQEISTAQPEDARHWDTLSMTAITIATGIGRREAF